MLRSLFPFFLTLSLAFTGLTMGQMRGAAAATGQMVICAGQGTTLVYVDAEGQPTAAPHLCPDCLIMLAPDGSETPVTLAHNAQAAVFVTPLADRAPSATRGPTPPPRAPPLTV